VEENLIYFITDYGTYNCDLIIENKYQGIVGLPEKALGEGFKVVDGKLTFAFGDVYYERKQLSSSSTYRTETPYATSPFILYEIGKFVNCFFAVF
jgi:hypothetical protein